MIKNLVVHFKQLLIAYLILQIGLGPAAAIAAERITGVMPAGSLSARVLPTISSNALPELREIVEGAHMAAETSDNYMEVVQEEEHAIIEWDSFNIGSDSHVYFNQTNDDGEAMTGWHVLNRIYDNDPSQIFGQLTADGKVFLINQNGLLFGPNARITNLYSLVASTMNMADDDFHNNIWSFQQEDYIGSNDDGDVSAVPFVENRGLIDVQNGGAIFLMGPEVTNSGSINAPNGHAALIAGQAVTLYNDDSTDSTRPQKYVVVSDAPGQALNQGQITAQGGVAGMYGGVVNQEGLITSVTAVYQNGTVELLASDRIVTGRDSLTGTPLLDSDDTVDRSFDTQESTVTLGRLQTSQAVEGGTAAQYDTPDEIDHFGRIEAPSGDVTLMAEQSIVLEEGSSIDVSGAWAQRSASDNQIAVQLNSVELSDDFLARAGNLLGETILVNALVGSDIGHIDGYLNQGEMTVAERCTAGGTVEMETTGDDGHVVVQEGAEIDFSGGGVYYSAGNVQTSKVRIGDQIYDIGDIPDDVLEMADQITLVDDRTAAAMGSTHIGHTRRAMMPGG